MLPVGIPHTGPAACFCTMSPKHFVSTIRSGTVEIGKFHNYDRVLGLSRLVVSRTKRIAVLQWWASESVNLVSAGCRLGATVLYQLVQEVIAATGDQATARGKKLMVLAHNLGAFAMPSSRASWASQRQRRFGSKAAYALGSGYRAPR